MEPNKVTFTIELDGCKRVAEFDKMADLMEADDEAIGSWLRMLATPGPTGALTDWLKLYTWQQSDGTFDFAHPRPRPEGLAVDAREGWAQA